MKKLLDKIKTEGVIINKDVLKVDSFLNHQIDPTLMKQIGDEFYEYFKKYKITKIITIESSGIAPAVFCGYRFQVPVIFIKKTNPSTMKDALFANVHSFTKNKTYTVCLSKQYIDDNDNILFIDDFLANGEAFKGVEEIIHQTSANLCGVGIVIEKAYQQGHKYIINQGYDLYALASIASLDNNQITFKKASK
ncbi:xanthine phosphoribosyltransferase [Breznakia sp. PF5-3]|uniref:xanthine phosphoribosyltransferase n=1 Tax=unclassified Breznakia TaxID=2623764 RepID=UPI002406FFB5|nr:MULTISPECIES: xanthine phosphoribosyltransferase [unclassified Breznakia]MDL2276463.1 xanthine phosphoribosyltransferase [Breznakia sp. OttesenSCG-928-G09]MDF9823902.1 xanthine phosphoribosyltransferase [Breznakia sp. PM6-1]MDF9834701.1 xanthine phosphoribosyltransferase [Breznakia sp. PF5-3]MDF9836864.1 xanthine phosphoribosyltransferase [Breznakia sp. PFB2-8]MDF9858881.1 xanthine phosphoribosyltransferase [Breznakia sp. PH5-24]